MLGNFSCLRIVSIGRFTQDYVAGRDIGPAEDLLSMEKMNVG